MEQEEMPPPPAIQLPSEYIEEAVDAIQASRSLTAAEKITLTNVIMFDIHLAYSQLAELKQRLINQELYGVPPGEDPLTEQDRAQGEERAEIQWRGKLDRAYAHSLNPIFREWCRIIKQRATEWLNEYDYQ